MFTFGLYPLAFLVFALYNRGMEKTIHNGIAPKFWMYDVPVSSDGGLVITEFGWHRPDPVATFKETRDNYLVEFVLDGVCTLGVNGYERAVRKGQAFCVPPATQHYYSESSHDPSKRFWISFSGVDADSVARSLPFNDDYVARFYDYETLLCCIDELYDARENSKKSQLIVFSCFYKLLSVFFPSDEKPRAEKKDLQLVRDISRFIELNISNDVSVDSLCKSFGYSRTALFEKSKNATGVSIKKFLIDKRIGAAKYMLSKTDMPLTEIAYSCGYVDANALNKTFMRHVGESISSYRKKSRT